jgi:hypothetical protein
MTEKIGFLLDQKHKQLVKNENKLSDKQYFQ